MWTITLTPFLLLHLEYSPSLSQLLVSTLETQSFACSFEVSSSQGVPTVCWPHLRHTPTSLSPLDSKVDIEAVASFNPREGYQDNAVFELRPRLSLPLYYEPTMSETHTIRSGDSISTDGVDESPEELSWENLLLRRLTCWCTTFCHDPNWPLEKKNVRLITVTPSC